MIGQRVVLLAGWLFLDLMLVIVLTQLGSVPAAPAASPASRPTPAAPPTTTHPAQPGLDPVSKTIQLTGNADQLIMDDPRAQRALVGQITAAAQHFTGRRAALVLVFGTYRPCSACAATTEQSANYSAAVIPLFHQAAPQLFPATLNFYRNYIDLDAEAGSIKAEIFFFTR
jgi:hypothetical protein